ncbi:MAG: bifunctional enoyl-CoA hydratase/phosphate acetyltransferase [Alphaproteobacteria bacterium]|jgi:phosphate acetyltransferase|nr:bifunctional enoyl-CoA hydratase/phosphate acetyltransferase [Alphaproteobacteria bacterium]MBT7942350.1 bifunctional enoyl-CoA hydratase/phosphate acetyltransferase [Alphaproteobacteria bacterium]
MLSKKPFEVPPYLLEKATHLPRCPMAVAGADNEIALESARQACDAGIITPVLVGDTDIIQSLAHVIGWDIADVEIVDQTGEEEIADAVVSLAASGATQSIMKGHVHTDALMRAVVQRDSGLRTERRISHVFHMTIPGRDKVLLITDGAVNVAPTVNTRMDIIRNAVDMAHALGNREPKVAILSGAEVVNPSMPSSVEGAEIVERARKGEIDGCLIDGPFAFDLAVSPVAAKIKEIDSPVAGRADILVVPNIEMGNGLFKMMAHFMSGLAAGVVLGAKVPIVLTSRADPPEARFAATLIAAIIAHKDAMQPQN